jgi:hypothetical protein
MPRDYLVLEAVPTDEAPADLDARGYAARARQCCAAFIAQVRRQFGPEPQGAALKTRAMPHDVGTYYTVVCYYDDPEAEAYALRLEADLPACWDAQARQELGLAGE